MKRVTRKLAAIGGAACLAVSIMTCPLASLPVQAAAPGTEEARPYSDIIKWRFKEENGSVYRRRYNYSTNTWIGEWEYMGPIPEGYK